jgi:hypothetical protein
LKNFDENFKNSRLKKFSKNFLEGFLVRSKREKGVNPDSIPSVNESVLVGLESRGTGYLLSEKSPPSREGIKRSKGLKLWC